MKQPVLAALLLLAFGSAYANTDCEGNGACLPDEDAVVLPTDDCEGNGACLPDEKLDEKE
jgi:hypothetical protein